MDISCEIIRDLLPLYAEDMVSNATREMVDQHLCRCAPCTKQLASLKKAAQLPIDVETQSLKRVGDIIRRRRILAVMASVLTLVTIVLSGFTYMMTPYFLTAEEAIEGVELRPDGSLAVDIARGVIGHAGFGVSKGNDGHLWHTTRYDWMYGRIKDNELGELTQEDLENYIMELHDLEVCEQKDLDQFNNVYLLYGTWKTKDGQYVPYDPEICDSGAGSIVWRYTDENQWYLNIHTGEAETLLWDAGYPAPEDPMMDNTYLFAVFFVGGVLLSFLLWFIARYKKGYSKEMLSRIAILCGSTAFSTLLVTGGDLIIIQDVLYTYFEWPKRIALLSVFVVLTSLFWRQLYILNKQDKGQ